MLQSTRVAINMQQWVVCMSGVQEMNHNGSRLLPDLGIEEEE